jgi:diadenosine tetraphosphatase ApaH/serine/threonine PP2A family protein phosphatase
MHGNWDAFSAVLRRVKRKKFDATLVLGDLVGYGAGPNQVVEAVRELEGNGVVHTVRGNHDKVVAELEDGSNFNQPALLAARWTTERLTPANLRYVRELPKGPKVISDELQICHGSPLDEDTYVFSIYDAYEIFSNHDARVIFFGHTHIPSLFVLHSKGIEVAVVQDDSFTLTLEDDKRYLLNPGSIGQPRDRDPRAAYFTYDSDSRTIRWQRVEYAVEKAQERITRSGLPKVLADRLALGI